MEKHQQEGKELIDIVINPEVIHSVGSYVLCTILSFMRFLTALRSPDAKEEDLVLITNRIVKALVSKKKYSRSSYEGRSLKRDAPLTKH